MPRVYNVAAAALALGVSRKTLDNLLSRHRIPGLAGGRQGRTRKLAPDMLLLMAVALELASGTGLPLGRALQLAQAALSGHDSAVEVAPGIRLILDRASLERRLGSRLREAVEVAIPPRRGRPPMVRGRG